jgi:hypothetical protein
MLRQPTAKPEIGPPMVPATITKNAVGLTLGGPPANANLKATFAAERAAIKVRVFVLLGIGCTWMDYPAQDK